MNTETQLREDLHAALDQPTPSSILDPAALVARGSRTLRRRRLVAAGGAMAAAAAFSIGAVALTGDVDHARPLPAHSLGTPERVTISVQDPNVTAPSAAPFVFGVTAARDISDGGITVSVTSDAGGPHTVTFPAAATADGTATAWLDPHTLVAATPVGAMTTVLTYANDNTGSGADDLPALGINLTVMSFRESMGEASPIGLVWRARDGSIHSSTNAKLQHLRVNDAKTSDGPAEFWASEPFNIAGVFSTHEGSTTYWRTDGYQAAMRLDDQATGLSTFVVEVDQATALSFAGDSSNRQATTSPVSVTRMGPSYWAVFRVQTKSVGLSSMISWVRPDGSTFTGIVP